MSSDTKSLSEMLAELDSDRPESAMGPIDPIDDPPSKEEDKHTRRLKMMSEEEKLAQTFDLRMRGLTVQNIAVMFGVDQTTVYRWLKRYHEQYRERMEQEPGANLIAETLMYYEHLEQACLYEATQLEADKAEVGKDGKVSRSNSLPIKQMRLRYIEAALKIRQQKVDLLTITGVIPKEREKVYHVLSEEKRSDEIVEDTGISKPREQILNNIMRLLEKGRSLG